MREFRPVWDEQGERLVTYAKNVTWLQSIEVRRRGEDDSGLYIDGELYDDFVAKVVIWPTHVATLTVYKSVEDNA